MENENVTVLPGAEYVYINQFSKASIEKINVLFSRDFELFEYEVLR